jgi:alkaline phosphatase D
MALTRRQFLWTAAASSVCVPALLRAQEESAGSATFEHGVASGDPLGDRVILWTRVTPPADQVNRTLDVRWTLASDQGLTRVVARGTAQASAARDFTVKTDVRGLQPGRHYYYGFEFGGERSPVGRTRTASSGDVERLRLALCCCANYPAGYFNAYARMAERDDLDAVVHVGDYIYEFQNGIYGDGVPLFRLPEPRREAVTLSDYRIRYATYRKDKDLQAAHARHPFIVVWDDHEITNDAWSGGAGNHNPDKGEGDWATRRAAAYRAYVEWMPLRESGSGVHLYRRFRFGNLADLVMLDTRGLRDQQVPGNEVAALTRPDRTLLGKRQQDWLFDQLHASQRGGRAWRIVGQQVMFSRLALPGRPVALTDTWDGYQAARDRVLDFLATDKIDNVAILSGDIHSSWGFDVPRNAWDGYDPASGKGSMAVEIVSPAISSPPLFSDPVLRSGEPGLRATLPHLKYLDGDNNGYVVLDVTRDRLQSDWYLVANVRGQRRDETRAMRLVCERGSSRLVAG